MPQQWWFVLRERSSGQGRFSPAGCNGLINRLWPQADAATHEQAKPWVLHGFPQAAGGTYVWSVTWLADQQSPPHDLRDQIGSQWALGARTFDVESVIAGTRRTWAHLLETRPARVLQISTVTPVLAAQEGTWTPYPTLSGLLGTAPRKGAKPSSSSHRQHGVFSIIQAYAVPQIAALVTDQLVRSVPHLTLSLDRAGYSTQQVPGPEQHLPTALGKGPRPPSPWGWAGRCTLSAQQPDAQQGLAIIGAILQVAGVGKSTAYGYGCVTVEIPRTPGRVAISIAPTQSLDSTEAIYSTDDNDEQEWLDILFETP